MELQEQFIETIVYSIISALKETHRPLVIPVGVSNRHIHLSQEHLEALFGKGYQLNVMKELQPGEFAAQETVILVGPKGVYQNVRILGPVRKKTQVEISRTDGYVLGINPPLRDSGDLDGSAGATLVGPKGAVTLAEGVIVAKRHIHMPTRLAEKLGLKNNQRIDVFKDGERSLIFKEVLIRTNDNAVLEMHIDTDEANAAGISNKDTVLYGGELFNDLRHGKGQLTAGPSGKIAGLSG
ncbi:MAG: phosphate propanoyltransferase [Clostridia bacterium]|nr:phosphate propanoyltransferase [Clostridia bacterium]